ncbi:MAG: hypothetical protein HYT75_03945 [Deltaproteobacteria bacterium]|nr:hypothetical protein [Deltaproteobacteria bacterium]
MTGTALFVNANSINCANNDLFSSAQCALQKISGEWGDCAVPHLSPTRDPHHQTSVYIDWDHNRQLTTIIFGLKGSTRPAAAYVNHNELETYRLCIEKKTKSDNARSTLASALQFIDYISLMLILTPGSLLAKLFTKILPKLAVKITNWLAKHAIARAVAYITSSNFAKAILMAVTHVLNNGAKSFEPDPSILKEWFGEGRAWVTLPLSGALITGIGLFARRFAWSEIALNTLFSTTAGLHHHERMNLNAKLTKGSEDRAIIEDKLRTHAFDISLFLLFSGTAAALNSAKWLGTATCAVDDILPAAVRVLKAQEAH